MVHLTFEYKSETSTVATCIHICILYKNNNTLLTAQSLCIRKDVNMDLDIFIFLLPYTAHLLVY